MTARTASEAFDDAAPPKRTSGECSAAFEIPRAFDCAGCGARLEGAMLDAMSVGVDGRLCCERCPAGADVSTDLLPAECRCPVALRLVARYDMSQSKRVGAERFHGFALVAANAQCDVCDGPFAHLADAASYSVPNGCRVEPAPPADACVAVDQDGDLLHVRCAPRCVVAGCTRYPDTTLGRSGFSAREDGNTGRVICEKHAMGACYVCGEEAGFAHADDEDSVAMDEFGVYHLACRDEEA